MTKHSRIMSDVPTADPDSKNIKTKYFRGTDGLFNNGKGCNHYAQNIVFYVISVKVYFT